MGNVVLGLLLLAGPQTIYSLHKLFGQGVSLFYRASLGALRGALAGLLERGEVVYEESIERGRSKKTYRPTEAGVAAFRAWMLGPIAGSDVETVALSKLFLLGLVESAAERRAILDGVVERIREDADELDALAAELDRLDLPPEAQRALDYQRSALAYGIGAHRFALAHFAAIRDAEPQD